MTPESQSTRSFLGSDSVNTFQRQRISKQQSRYWAITMETVFSVWIRDNRIIWRLHIEIIKAKAFRTFIRIYSLFESELLSANIKRTLHKALIRSAMIYAYPAWKLAADTCLLKLQVLQNKVAEDTQDRHDLLCNTCTDRGFAYSAQARMYNNQLYLRYAQLTKGQVCSQKTNPSSRQRGSYIRIITARVPLKNEDLWSWVSWRLTQRRAAWR
jgi:hypothetical protein